MGDDMLLCIVAGCSRERSLRRGMCNSHYTKWLRDTPKEDRRLAPAEDRFFRCVNKNGSLPPGRPDLGCCWEWTRGGHSYGYGVFYVGSKQQVLAHRWSLAHHLGRDLDPACEVMHECDNPPCVNPLHLTEGTHAQNMGGAKERGRSAKISELITHCIHDHEYTKANTIWATRTTKSGTYLVRKCRECNKRHCKEYKLRKKGEII